MNVPPNIFNDYELQQLKKIDEWNKEEPWVVTKIISTIFHPLNWLVSKVIPSSLIQGALEGSDWLANKLTDENDVMREANVGSKNELQYKSLDKLDSIANSVHNWALGIAATLGGAGGAAGLPAMVVEIPAVITLALRTIRKIGVCYGYGENTPEERQFILSILASAGANSIEEKAEAIVTLRMVETLIAKNTWQKIYEKAGEGALLKIAGTTAQKALTNKTTEIVTEGTIRKSIEAIERKIAQGLVSIKEFAKKLGVNITKRKALQAIPIIGGIVGAGTNSIFIRDVAWAARFAYQELSVSKLSDGKFAI
jgi:hypothetical protein